MVGWTPYAKRRMAESMYRRGVLFLKSSQLLQDQMGYNFVCAHLMCQGLEIVLKSLLLMKDYDKYRYTQKVKSYGHNLLRLANEVTSIYGLKPMRQKSAR